MYLYSHHFLRILKYKSEPTDVSIIWNLFVKCFDRKQCGWLMGGEEGGSQKPPFATHRAEKKVAENIIEYLSKLFYKKKNC